jgi:hypothetical protein
MTSVLLFLAGLVVGAVATVAAGVAIINRSPPPRTTPIYAVNGGRSTRIDRSRVDLRFYHSQTPLIENDAACMSNAVRQLRP